MELFDGVPHVLQAYDRFEEFSQGRPLSMRPRAIQSVPGLKPDSSPAERFERFARMIVSVPKVEADREMEQSGLKKYGSVRPSRPSKKRRGITEKE